MNDNTYLHIRKDDDFHQEQTSRWVYFALWAGVLLVVLGIIAIPLYLGTR